ncbi:Acetyltransferase YpeA [Frankliniella fusca]|uniref:Acetyltransferase YpeA n=1 Tax=Frankliniella fusca TaxID=407009 RepID=A0AAE1HIP2_9NEOP|nr:Acetyltransferase YpeA [Frankliniella fusca]
MELVPEGKNFRLVQEAELPEILEFLSGHLPAALKFHQALKTFLNDRVWDFHFYISKSWPDEPVALHFPGMTSSPNGQLYESFCVFCPLDRLDSLALLRDEDVLVDWTRPIFLNFTHEAIMDRIQEFYKDRGTLDKVCGDVYVCDGEVHDQDLHSSPLLDAAMHELRAEHAKDIHGLYPANDMECLEVFEKLLHALPSYGVFSSSGELAAWMVQSYYGAMFSMQTRPQFRRKGYGTHLAQSLTKLVIQRGYIPFVIIRPENEASLSLYHKLGFRRAYRTVRAVLRPQGWPRGADDLTALSSLMDPVPVVDPIVESLAAAVPVPIEFVDVPAAFADAEHPPEQQQQVSEALPDIPAPPEEFAAPDAFRADAVPAIPAPEAFRRVFTSEVFRKLPDLAPPEFIIGTLEVLAREQPVVAAPEAFRNEADVVAHVDIAPDEAMQGAQEACVDGQPAGEGVAVVELAAPAAE